jgi:LmbE family N-acetylglucosaminyl deacetylase
VLSLNFDVRGRGKPRFLFLGAHCDDVEIGCGGTVLELLARYPSASVDWIVLSSDKARAAEARRAAKLFLAGARESRVTIKGFRNGFFPTKAAEIKEFFEQIKSSCSPDVIFTHYRDDLHQDHRIVGELTWNTFRDHLILEYEIPKYDGGLGSPNVFVPLTRASRDRKIEIVMKTFASQRSKAWFSADTFDALLRLRGIECNAPHGIAEAYYARKIAISTKE